MAFWTTVLTKITSGFFSNTTLNNNFEKIEDGIDGQLNRYPDDFTGSPAGNAMHTEVDMNSERIVNLTKAPVNNAEATNKLYVDTQDASVIAAYKAADDVLRNAYEGADNALSTRINGLELGGVAILASDPPAPARGQIYFNTNSELVKYYTNAGWQTVATIVDLENIIVPYKVDAGNNATILHKGTTKMLDYNSTVKRVSDCQTYLGDGFSKKITTGIDYSEALDDGYIIFTRNDNSSANDNRITLLHDSIIGLSGAIVTSDTLTDTAAYPNALISIDNDGYTLGNSVYTNEAETKFLTFSFRTNARYDGTDSSGNEYTNRHNTKTGVSFGRYTGSGQAGQMLKHSLQKTPYLVITKNLTTAQPMVATVRNIGFGEFSSSSSVRPNITGRTPVHDDEYLFPGVASSDSTNIAGNDYMYYAFTGRDGYSFIDTYYGTGDPVFIPTGIDMTKENLVVMIKIMSGNGQWYILRREGTETIGYVLTSGLTSDTENVVFQADGIIVNPGNLELNLNGQIYLMMVFEDNFDESDKDGLDVNPFVTTIATGLDGAHASSNDILQTELQNIPQLGSNTKNFIYTDALGDIGYTTIKPRIIEEFPKYIPALIDVGAVTNIPHYDYSNVSGTVSESSRADASSTGYNAFNRDSAARWRSNSGDTVGAWLQYKLKGSPRLIRRFQWATNTIATGRVTGVRLQGYSEDTGWVLLLDVVDVVLDAAGYSPYYDIVYPNPLNYYRVEMTQLEDAIPTSCYIKEVNISYEEVIVDMDYYDYKTAVMRDFNNNAISRTYIGEVVSDQYGNPISTQEYPTKVTRLADLELYGTINGQSVDDFLYSSPTAYGVWHQDDTIVTLAGGYNIAVIYQDNSKGIVIQFREPMDSQEYAVSISQKDSATLAAVTYIEDQSVYGFTIKFKSASSTPIVPVSGSFTVVGGKFRYDNI
jgi:hypothetical protein